MAFKIMACDTRMSELLFSRKFFATKEYELNGKYVMAFNFVAGSKISPFPIYRDRLKGGP